MPSSRSLTEMCGHSFPLGQAHQQIFNKWCVVASVMPNSVTPWTVCSPPGSSDRGILQARILEWVAMPSSRGSSPPRDQTPASLMSPALWAGFYHQSHCSCYYYFHASHERTKIETNMVLLQHTPWLIGGQPWAEHIPKRPGITE